MKPAPASNARVVDETSVSPAAASDATGWGLPVVHGEHAGRGGYHYYPERSEVAGWLDRAGLDIVEQDVSPGDEYAYYHVLARPRPA